MRLEEEASRLARAIAEGAPLAELRVELERVEGKRESLREQLFRLKELRALRSVSGHPRLQ